MDDSRGTPGAQAAPPTGRPGPVAGRRHGVRAGARVGALALATLLAPSAVAAQSGGVLRDQLGFGDKELEALQGGRPVVRVPKAEDRREVTVVAAVRVDTPAPVLVEHLRAIDGAQQRGASARGGRIPAGARPAGWLSLPGQDADALPKCRPGKCDVKLRADLIEAAAVLDWSGDRAAVANGFMEETLLDLLDAYRADGASALMVYNDKAEPLSVAEGLGLLLERSSWLAEQDPVFHAHLRRYPEDRDEDADDVFYWSLDEFGLKPTLTLNHMAVKEHADGPLYAATVAVKQIYAAHYFQTVLELYHVVGAPDDPARRSYLAAVIRGRFDGEVRGLKRGFLEDGLRKHAKATLAEMKETLEAGPRG